MLQAVAAHDLAAVALKDRLALGAEALVAHVALRREDAGVLRLLRAKQAWTVNIQVEREQSMAVAKAGGVQMSDSPCGAGEPLLLTPPPRILRPLLQVEGCHLGF